jgi:DNA mismatch endonuclease (patch repair protein)
MDVFSRKKRSEIMSKIRGKGTAPELIVRKVLFASGYRYRLNVRKMAGQPDIVLRKYRAVIFVHGCFWHGHHCRIDKLPVDNKTYWLAKMARNRERDKILYPWTR